MLLSHSVLIVVICAVCTFATRVIPFALFRGNRKMPDSVSRLAQLLPPAIIAVLVVYCLRGIPSQGIAANAVTLISVALVAILHLWKKNTLFSIGAGTVFYMIANKLIIYFS